MVAQTRHILTYLSVGLHGIRDVHSAASRRALSFALAKTYHVTQIRGLSKLLYSNVEHHVHAVMNPVKSTIIAQWSAAVLSEVRLTLCRRFLSLIST